MYFPWVGLLEQIKLSDTFVHYSDVQFTKGFYNRVQVKTPQGTPWLTVPTMKHHRDQKINEVLIDSSKNWKKQHFDILKLSYAGAPYCREMLDLVERTFSQEVKTIADIGIASIMALVDYFNLREGREFFDSEKLCVTGRSTQRLLDITKFLEGNIYITGHGAKNYLDHELFEKSNISVEYIKYLLTPYSQLHGEFTPYVTSLDLIANCGKQGAELIHSGSVNWRKFIYE